MPERCMGETFRGRRCRRPGTETLRVKPVDPKVRDIWIKVRLCRRCLGEER